MVRRQLGDKRVINAGMMPINVEGVLMGTGRLVNRGIIRKPAGSFTNTIIRVMVNNEDGTWDKMVDDSWSLSLVGGGPIAGP